MLYLLKKKFHCGFLTLPNSASGVKFDFFIESGIILHFFFFL
ncbi:putative uncharacterized protein [Parachlamydia acanthamoebae UV-7]|uniref:Uncharacterized protein n=1 Tax=Parachlamydia acanthamoebae (strain UV7) TaxID=765952 RepID=F8KXM8_PARAV|nr:hypothetical protein pah_c253o051 [Parachlamydia acanthamoebae str. Hall's coccus]CCB87499.1 putative uncharacterized protein [Parachlamydia acanthamoebae UV-7]